MLARRWFVAATLIGAGIWAGLSLRIVQVADDEMAPSLRAGDWVVLGPAEVDPGDVVWLDDPSEPGRKVLRRVVAIEDHPVRFRGGRLVTGGKGVPIKEMGRVDDRTVLAEANRWLIAHRAPMPSYAAAELVVGEDELYVLADNRDLGVDSRWWGPVPEVAAERELWLRLGASDAWRDAVLVGSEDGPWAKPTVEPPS